MRELGVAAGIYLPMRQRPRRLTAGTDAKRGYDRNADEADFAAFGVLDTFAHMKHNKLHGVAHNYTASLAGGLSFVVPYHVLLSHVFAEAAANENGFLVANFLTGEVEGAYPGGGVEYALPLFKNAFPDFCEKHEVDFSDFRAFMVRFIAYKNGNSYVITIEDSSGRRSSREYVGNNGKRSETLDDLGRRRPKILDSPLD